ncbi:CRAL-TRIO domain-containing protein C3H8.02 [Penicillium subrubescens]|jgi:hypothetical protein|uniref:CRAL-TRIO domain-containing protein C3H8.02 n=1 Tax=Penicillium subrubescens TaxID=1316194 RepID=A0A1Q5T2W5_9EURO|nr:CRAL-TRIO domain-containing protein C3H8.02 [Penicillium subrubescens]
MTITLDTSTGYVHNLTPSQEAKLRELWILLFSSAASVLSAVYEVPLPEGSPNKLFEILDRVNEPTVEAIINALKEEDSNGKPSDSNGTASQANREENGLQNGASKEQESLDKVEALMNKDAQKNIMSEIATKKVTPQHFASLFAQLRKMGVQESEIKSMEKILSKMTPEEMCFSILKMIKQEHPDSLLLRFLRARKWDVGKGFTMMVTNILWRREMEVDDDILPKGELYALEQSRDEKLTAKQKKEGRDFIEQLKTGKSFLHGFDRQGRPVNYVRVKIHKPGAQSEEVLERYIVHVIETTRLIVVPPIETGVRDSWKLWMIYLLTLW